MICNFLFLIILLGILVEAIIQLWFESLPMKKIKEILYEKILYYMRKYNVDGEMIIIFNEFYECKYCQSVWVAWVFTYLIGLIINIYVWKYNIIFCLIIFFFVGIVVHRLSNYLHAIYDYFYYAIKYSNEENPLNKLEI